MARPQSKKDLLEAADLKYKQLKDMIGNITEDELERPYDFSKDSKKKEAHWSRDKNLRDVLIHLYEWHQLAIKWINTNMKGTRVNFLPEPYNWKTYGDMNLEFFHKHQNTGLEEAKGLLEESHDLVTQIITSLSNDELFTKNVFDWAGTSTVGSYLVSVTSSHYEWAMKKMKAHKKSLV